MCFEQSTEFFTWLRFAAVCVCSEAVAGRDLICDSGYRGACHHALGHHWYGGVVTAAAPRGTGFECAWRWQSQKDSELVEGEGGWVVSSVILSSFCQKNCTPSLPKIIELGSRIGVAGSTLDASTFDQHKLMLNCMIHQNAVCVFFLYWHDCHEFVSANFRVGWDLC